MFSHKVREVMDRKKLVKAPPSTTVLKAAKLMASKQCGAVLVVQEQKLIGIFTERDALYRVIAQGLDPAATVIGDVMTTSPRTVDPDHSFGHALYTMSQNRFRHLPVIKDGVPIGIVSSRSAMDPELEEFASETARRKHFSRQADA
jgi:CBS domain-containing protein